MDQSMYGVDLLDSAKGLLQVSLWSYMYDKLAEDYRDQPRTAGTCLWPVGDRTESAIDLLQEHYSAAVQVAQLRTCHTRCRCPGPSRHCSVSSDP